MRGVEQTVCTYNAFRSEAFVGAAASWPRASLPCAHRAMLLTIYLEPSGASTKEEETNAV